MDSDRFTDYYKLLGIEFDATSTTIKQKYHQLSLQHHPDKCGGEQTSDFVKINTAYKILSDPSLKQQYDFQYVAYTNKSSVMVHDELQIHDLEPDGDVCTATCRCGGTFQVFNETLKSLDVPVFVNCDTCSLCISVSK